MANFILSYTFLTILVGFAFFTIFKLKISDYMQMVPKHTDVVTMSSFSGFFSKLIAVGCFNFMTLANQLDSSAPFHTSFLNFYAGMLQTPFLGNKLNYILPGSMLIFSAIFVILSIVGYESKVIKILKRN